MTGITHTVIRRPAGELNITHSTNLTGAAGAILYIHGANMRGRSWARMRPYFPATQSFLAPDLIGHGDSARDENATYEISRWVDDCRAALEGLEAGPVHVVASSMGAAIAIELGAKYPVDVLTISTLGGAFLPAPDAETPAVDGLTVAEVADVLNTNMVDNVLSSTASPHVRQAACDDLSHNDARTVRAIDRAANATDVRSWIRQIHCPILVISGDQDLICPPTEAEWFSSATGSRLRVIEGAGHLPHYEQPSLTAELLRGHIATPTNNTERPEQRSD